MPGWRPVSGVAQADPLRPAAVQGAARAPKVTRIGFVGVGRMGLPMCANLVAAGHMVTAGDARAELERTVTQSGAQWRATLAPGRPRSSLPFHFLRLAPITVGRVEADTALTHRVTMCDWSSKRLGRWLARDKAGSAVAPRGGRRRRDPEHVGIFLQAPADVAAAGYRPAADPGARASPGAGRRAP